MQAKRAIGAREGPGTIWGRGGPVFVFSRDFVTVCECWSGRDSGERTQQEALADRTGASSRGRSVGRMAAGCRRRRQAGSGRARNRARARSNWASQGQRCGRCSVRRRAERVIRPAREKNRRRRVLVVTTCSPRPMRAVQRAMLWAITCTASQAALAAKRPEGRWFNPTPCLRSRMAFSISAWRRWSASSSRSRSVMKPWCRWRRASWEPGVGFTRRTIQLWKGVQLGHDEPHGAASGSLWKGVQVVRQIHRSKESASRHLRVSDEIVRLLCWRMVMEKRTSILRGIPRHECRTRC